MLKKKDLKERLEFHEIYHLEKIKLIQNKYKALKSRPKKLNVGLFKQRFYALLQGWRVRRIISYLKSLPEMKEAIDFIRLRFDIVEEDPSDLFQKQIISQFPKHIKIFTEKFYDLNENAVWIK